ncbi:DoxX family membrane protein [Salinirussus salinus]|jgi:hypothetical protein|uniref:DoxX family membrane protein n=1 Tax=Salinirussus salinus TaxID=1198300 RepID=UPI0013577F38|nr:DoxX family membrane protein [Salinirussus salinus]
MAGEGGESHSAAGSADLRERLRAAHARYRAWVARGPDPATVARVALGATILLAGLHKLVAPGAWAGYIVGWAEPLVVVSPRTFMWLNGPPEVLVGGLLLADRWAALAATVVAVSLAGTLVYLGLAALSGTVFATAMVRDVGLLGLAVSVLVASAR